jgi:membrane protein implicated in regulation of membrane protease activity
VSIVWYSVARFAIFGALFAVIYLLGANVWLAAAVALVLAAAISYLFLRRWRDAAARTLEAGVARRGSSTDGRAGRLARKIAEEEAREDEATGN